MGTSYSKGVGVESESGKLEIVLMHRPGDELLRLRPDNLEQLLYDAIPNLDDTHASHDIFSQYLRDHGTKVLEMKDLLCETLVYSEMACHVLIDGIVAHRLFPPKIHEEASSALYDWLLHRTPEQLVDDVIRGVACTSNELGVSDAAEVLLRACDPADEFVIPPLPNLLFTRDPLSIMEKNVFIWNMAKPARQNEPLIFRIIFKYHPVLSTSGLNVVNWKPSGDVHVTVEGGDVAYLGDGVLLIGCGERTNRAGIEAIVCTGLFHRVIACIIPQQRDYMHLDTVLSSVGRHAFTLHGPLTDKMEIMTVETHDDNNNAFSKPKWVSHGNDVCRALRKLLHDPRLIFYDAQDEQTSVQEQHDCLHNVVVLNDCHIATYAGGDEHKGVVAQMTRDNACRVDLIPRKGLLEGGGGAHCMTNAIRRRHL